MKGEHPKDLRERLKAYALCVIELCGSLPRSEVNRVLGRQLLRSGTSVGAHYREACRARSNAEFISKIETSLQELDESDYWLELIIARGNGIPDSGSARVETQELIAMFTAAVKKAKRNGDR